MRRRHLLRISITMACAISVAPPAGAQGAIRGVVFDSLASRPLADAMVEVDGSDRMTTTDKQGRFRLDDVPSGVRRIRFSAPALDSIGLFGFARDVEVKDGSELVVPLATPSFRTMYAQLCAPIDRPARDSAIVFGTIKHAATGMRLAGAHVQFSWFVVSRNAEGVRMLETARTATSDARGDFGMCGLPSELTLNSVALTAAEASGLVAVTIGSARVLRLDLLVSPELFTVAAGASARTTARGEAMLRGSVRDERGRALVNALVVLPAADTAIRTDDAGRFRITDAPAGTQQVEVRQLGLGAVTRTVTLESGKVAEVEFVLSRATVLSTVNVTGNRIGADQNAVLLRRKSAAGQYLDATEIARRPDIASVLSRLPGIMIQRNGMGFNVYNSRPISFSGRCVPQIVIDGIPQLYSTNASTIPLEGRAPEPSNAETLLAQINPKDMLAVEFYATPADMPMQYSIGKSFDCGMLLVWTKAARW